MWQATRLFWPALVMTLVAASATFAPAIANEPAASAAPADDYYTKRARTILERERSAINSPPHPLALDHPDKFVVVCEAGCSKQDVPEIVGAEPRNDHSETGAMHLTTAARLDAAPEHADAPSLIECMGGCYGNDQTYHRSRPPIPRAANAEAEASPGAWITSVEQSDTAAPPEADKFSPVR